MRPEIEKKYLKVVEHVEKEFSKDSSHAIEILHP